LQDRSQALAAVRLRRQRESEAAQRVDAELVATAPLHGRDISHAALVRLEHLLAGAIHRLGVQGGRHVHVDGAIRCTVERTTGHHTIVSSPEGTLRLRNLTVTVATVAAADHGLADAG
jgi:hypothetical protein